MALAAIEHELKALILSFHPIIVVETAEEERLDQVLYSAARDLHLVPFEWTATQGLLRLPGSVPFHGTTLPSGALRHAAGLTVEGVFHFKDFSPHLANAVVARAARDLVRGFTGRRSTLVLSGAPVELPGELEAAAVRLEWRLPGATELRRLVASVVRSLRARRGVEVRLDEEGVEALVRMLTGLTLSQARQVLAWAGTSNGILDASDLARVGQRKATVLADGGLLELLPAEENHFEIGGFGRLKAWLDRARVGFSAEARELNLPAPRGLLLVGVQGCGKSLAAKYVAHHWQLPLLKLEAGRLYDKYVGETERNFRRATAVAEALAPVVLWIDEIEKAFAQDAAGGADGGLSRRLLGAFLTWLQEKRAEVFVVGAANDLMALPPELLRKGRFDEIFFVDLPTAAEREEIFRIHLALRKQPAEAFEIPLLAAATDGFSGAEIEQAVVAALYRALHQKQPLTTALLLEELAGTSPLSVSRHETIARLRQEARGRFVPVA
jgi:hypothetical protein